MSEIDILEKARKSYQKHLIESKTKEFSKWLRSMNDFSKKYNENKK